MQFDQILQYTLSGLSTGAIYALIGIGFSIIYNATGIINFAQGEFVMLGALSFVTLWGGCHLPLAVAFAITVVGVALLGMVFERLAIRTVRRPHPIVLVIITVGVSIFLRGVAMLGWGKDAYGVASFSKHAPLRIAGASLLPQSLWIIGIVLIVVLGLQVFFKRTLTGKAMQACARLCKGIF